MRALAILGPNASRADVRRFQLPGAEITIAERVRSGEQNPDAALIFGGDGTIHHHLTALEEQHVPLLVVPKGSGNDFAHALGIRSVAGAFAAWNTFCNVGSNVREIDLGSIIDTGPTRNPKLETRNFFCCVAGAGLDSEANRRANAMPRWLRARGGYAIGLMAALAHFRPPLMRISLAASDGVTRTLEEPATMVAVGNAPSYGRGMRIAPRARLDDGLLDVCFVRRVAPLRLLRFFPRVYTGAHLEMREVEYAQVSRLKIETDSPLPLYADGEYICNTPVVISILPRALRVICAL